MITRGWKRFEGNVRKSLDYLEGNVSKMWMLELILVRAPKEKRRAVEKAAIILENTGLIKPRMLAEIWALKGGLVRSQMGMRYMLLESG